MLKRILLADELFVAILHAVRDLDLPLAAVGGGAVRSVVWDALSERPRPTEFQDIDVAYFQPDRLCSGVEQWAEQELTRRLPEYRWDVKNQAAVNLWYQERFGVPADPFRSLEAAVATWPETATAVAVRLEPDDSLSIIAPLGLDDLVEMVWRHNPTRATGDHFRQRLADKRPAMRWPQVRIIDA
jgi:uncharacterized protein